ncbi:hypothetical protein GCM10010299_44230 [Streptomyces tanashiensis]|nr:hypothetical protein GCM10010299_44230 [Streptomyces tanashiensis]
MQRRFASRGPLSLNGGFGALLRIVCDSIHGHDGLSRGSPATWTTSSATPARAAGPHPARCAARVPAGSQAPTTPAASPRCPSSPRSGAHPPLPTVGQAGRGTPALPVPLASGQTLRAAGIHIGYARRSTLTQQFQSQPGR